MPTEDELESIVSALIDGVFTQEERETIQRAAQERGLLCIKQLAQNTAKGGGKE